MKTYNIIYLFTFLLIFASCSQDEEVKGGIDDVIAKIQLELPSMELPTVTKASSIENNIKELWLYMFDNDGKLIYQVQGTVGVIGDATKAVTANLKATKDAVTLMALANLPSSLAYEFDLNTSKADILKQLVFDTPSQNGDILIPMWGEVKLPNGLYTDDDVVTIPMTRAMACVEVLVDTDIVLNFDLKEVYLVGTYNKGFVAPVTGNGILQKGTISIPDGASGNRELSDSFHKTDLNNTGTRFYVPESFLTEDKLDNGETRRSLCIIIGGRTTIDGTTKDGFYRLDFLLKNTINETVDVKRNTRYTFKIEAVHEYGVPLEDALTKSIPDNASKVTGSIGIMVVGDTGTTQEDCIEKGLNDITTDGEDYLAVNNSTLTATYSEANKMYYAKIQIFTNCESGWQMIDMPDGIIAQQKKGNKNVFYETFIWIKPGVNPVFYIKAGGVWKMITVQGVS